jgi:hypothetical protein
MRPRENGPTNRADHVEAGETGKRCQEARLTAEAPLDVLEKDDPVCRGLGISHRRQQHRRHKCDAPDPQNDGEDRGGLGRSLRDPPR